MKKEISMMEEALVYQPEYNLLRDAYLGNKEMLQSKLNYLANIAQEEQCGARI